MRKKGRVACSAVVATAAGAAGLAVYAAFVRPWHLRWGATDDEIARSMPLDDRVSRPSYVTNRAVTVRAEPEQVWPWLVQIGELPRGGFYSYEWIERAMGMKVRNARRVIPELQHIGVGQILDRAGNMVVKAVEPNRCLVLGPPDNRPDMSATWALGLYAKGDGTARLVSRVRARLPQGPRGALWLALLDPGQFLMERKMLLALKATVERAHQ